MKADNMTISRPRKVYRLCVVLVVVLKFVGAVAWIGFIQPDEKRASAQDQTATEEAPLASLFTGDTCAPPCFFGIIPGKSTNQDVESHLRPLVEARLLGADLSQISRNIRFPFFWPYSTWETGRIFTNNNVVIEDGVVISIDVLMNRPVFLEEVLITFFEPSVSFVTSGFYDASLSLVYYDLGIVVNLDMPVEECSLSTFRDMRVSSLEYYPPQAIMENLDFYAENYNFLPSELLERWMTSQEKNLCTNAFGELNRATRDELGGEDNELRHKVKTEVAIGII